MQKDKVVTKGALTCIALFMLWTHEATAFSPQSETASQERTLEECELLMDQVHHLQRSLESKLSSHCYIFKAIRGQDVLISHPKKEGDASASVFWETHYFAKGIWRRADAANSLKLSGLSPGEEVKIKITHRQNLAYQNQSYSLAFGSYPVIVEANLDAPSIRNRVPVTDTGWATGLQTYGEMTSQTRYEDSAGRALKGGVARLLIFSGSETEKPLIVKESTSDDNGLAALTFTLGKCYGGELQAERNEVTGGYYWVSDYNLRRWYVQDGLVGEDSKQSEKYRMAGFAHICNQTLVRGRTDRW